MTFQSGDRVRMLSGFLGAGRTGTVISVRGDVHTVEFSGPRYLLDPHGEQEIKRLPYSAVELTLVGTTDHPDGSTPGA